MTVSNRLPTSGGVLRVLVDAFHLRSHVPKQIRCMLTGRTARAYFSGARVKQWCCRVTAAIRAARSADLLHAPAVLVGPDDLPEDALWFLALAPQASWWDAHVREHATTADARALLRVAGADVAMRVATIRLLTESYAPATETPEWADSRRRGEILQRLRSESRPRLGYVPLADALGVARSSLIDWCTGRTLPNEPGLNALVHYFATSVPGAVPSSVASELRWHFGLAALTEGIAEAFGWDFVKDLVSVVVRLLNCHVNQLRSALPQLQRNGHALLVSGLWPSIDEETLASHLATHGSEEWSRDGRRALELWRREGDFADDFGGKRQILDFLDRLRRSRSAGRHPDRRGTSR